MEAFKYIVFLFPVVLAACSTAQNFTPTSVPTSPILPSQTPLQTLTQTATQTEPQAPSPTCTPLPCIPIITGTIPVPYPYPTPISPPTLPPTLPPSPSPTLIPPETLSRSDPRSIVRWIQYGLENPDLSYIEPLLADQISYGLAFSDYFSKPFTKEEFVSELERRLPNHPYCIAYDVSLGKFDTISISTGGWDPPWEIDGREHTYMVLSLSNRMTGGMDLFLSGAFTSQARLEPGWNGIPCR